jgi:galactonate dehydratase
MNRRSFLSNFAALAALHKIPLLANTSSPDGSLKITGFKLHLTTWRWRSMLFLEIETDGGLVGLGEGTVWRRTEQVKDALEWLEPHFVGRDPAGIEDHWDRMYYQLTRWRSGAVLSTALSAVDMALWDLEGKRLGVPVWRLLGGPMHRELHAYYSHMERRAKSHEPAALADAVLAEKSRGWTAVKWATVGKGDTELERIHATCAKAKAVREATGPVFEFGIELFESFTPRSALRLARELAPYNPLFIEEPTWRENPDAMTDLALKSPVPVATGEGLVTPFEFKQLLDAKGAAIIQPDVMHCGGITMLRKIANLAELYGVEVAPHMAEGPIGHVASLMTMSVCRNFLIHEWEAEDDELFTELTDGTYPTQRNSKIPLPSGPGLGITVDFEEFKKRCPYKGTY